MSRVMDPWSKVTLFVRLHRDVAVEEIVPEQSVAAVERCCFAYFGFVNFSLWARDFRGDGSRDFLDQSEASAPSSFVLKSKSFVKRVFLKSAKSKRERSQCAARRDYEDARVALKDCR